MILLVDNYDSFTYNIFQMISIILEDDSDEKVLVVRNDDMTVKEIEALKPNRIIISPGPGIPANAGVSLELVQAFAGRVPILGICLGHQVLAEAFGAQIVQAKRIVHGKVEAIEVDGKGVLRNIPNPALFTRYHSLAVDPSSVPPELEITARAPDGEIMGLRHCDYPIEGVQFHPESIGSDHGDRLLRNFLHWRRIPLDTRGLLTQAIAGEDLSQEEAALFMDDLTDGALDDAYTGGLLTALTAKGVTAEELAGCASVLKVKKRSVHPDVQGVLDTCGTGGDGMHTFNISSFAALLAASCGAVVAKHGNRAVSSKSGSTDFFEALGIAVDLSPDAVGKMLESEGFAYMAAPIFHSAMRHAAPVRRALGVKTIMNCLGPLANPVEADYQVIGVYDEGLLHVMARAAKKLGVMRVMTVRSMDGLDEISPAAPTRIVRIDDEGREQEELFDPRSVGIQGHSVGDLLGGTGGENAQIALELLRGGGPPAVREAVCLNAGAALEVAGLAQNIPEGYRMAKAALEDGRAAGKLDSLRQWVSHG